MRGDGVVTRRTSLFLGISLAVLGSATMASAQGVPPPPPPPVGISTAQPVPAQPQPPPPTAASDATPRAPVAAPSGYPSYPPAMMIGPSRLPYVESEPIPPGYEVQTRPRMGLAKAGIATFVPLYGLSVLFGSVFLGSEKGDAKRYGAMLIPVAGPFATIATAETDEGTLFLVLDGIGQLTGATLFIAGMLADEKYLARKTAELNLRPEVFITPKSIAMRWQF